MENLTMCSLEVEAEEQKLKGVSVTPNPMSVETVFSFSEESLAPFELQIFDLLGNEVLFEKNITTHLHEVKRGDLSTGMYLYRVADKTGKWQSGKLFVE